jgi:Bacterial Ig domain/Divergent InlB B-repeat domain
MNAKALKSCIALFALVTTMAAGSIHAAPIVTITAPTNGAVFAAPASFTVRTSVSGGGNNVRQIEFFNGTNSLGVDIDNPYRMEMSDLPAGTYLLSAVLTDTAGGSSTNSVTIIVNALPGVAITNPADDSGLLAPATFVLQATASDSDGSVTQVQFFRGTTALGLATTNPSSVLVKGLGVGKYTFSAVATDNLGGKTTARINVTVKNRPTVAFTAPAANARLTNVTTLLEGTASDSEGVSAVEYSLNSTAFLPANGTRNWSISLVLPPGTNVVRVRATDTFSLLSLTNTRSFFQVVTSALSLTKSGTGAVTGATNGQVLEIGRGYQVTAIPGAGHVFSNWTGTASSAAPTLGFLMQSNMALQANFVPNPFLRVSGTFNGLFHESSQALHESSGDLTLRLTTSGSYTALLRPAGRRYATSGKLNLEGKSTNVIMRPGASSLTVRWAVDLNGLDEITGTVTDGQWLAPLLGDRATFNALTNPAPLTASYTLVVPGSQAVGSPAGDGWGTLRVSSAGKGVLAASLADGSRLTRSAPLSKNGEWPLYAPLYQLQGSLLGWVVFDTNAPLDDLRGTVDWFKPAQPAATLYPAGFTHQTTLTGSRYLAPATATNRVLALTNGVLILSAGNLSQAWTNDIVLSANNRVTNASPNKLAVTLSLTKGLFTGTFFDTGAVRTVKLSGALLQKSTNGAGFFLGTNASGRVLIQSLP